MARRFGQSSADFIDARDYARTLRLSGGPGVRDMDRVGGLPGLDGAILGATYGRSAADFAAALEYELDLEQRRRPHIFVRKFHASARKSRPAWDHGAQPSRLISATEFASAHAAAEFAYVSGLSLETSVTAAWARLGVEPATIPAVTLAFTKCARAWFTHKGLPTAYLFAHENGADNLHTHFLFAVPPSHRPAFREWVRDWAIRRYGGQVSYALRVRGPRQSQPELHWKLFSYLMKGYDPAAVVVSARNSPDEQAIRLGDLIAWPWHDPGPVPFKERIGICHNLGPTQRAHGAPFGYPRAAVPFGARYLEGIRYVYDLYPPDFYELVTGIVVRKAAGAVVPSDILDINFDTLNV